MKKTLSLLAAALAVSAPAFAQSAKFEGFSVSAGLGSIGTNTQYSLAPTSVPATEELPASSTPGYVLHCGKTSNLPVLDLAYGKRLDQNIVLGVGATLGLGKTQSGGLNVSSEEMSLGMSLVGKNHLSVYVQPTWVLTPDTGVFFKLGYHKMKGSVESDSAVPGLSSVLPSSLSFSGVGYGIGVKSYISKNVFIQAEATTINYKSNDLDLFPGTAKVKSAAGIVSIGMNF
jgi:opacity protein-like surface antigen